MNKQQKARLVKLEKHLRQMPASAPFDIGNYGSGDEGHNPCQTAGCALGECPALFPRSKWAWSWTNQLNYRGSPFCSQGTRGFFGLEYRDSPFDNFSYSDRHENPVTPKDVAKRIRKLLKEA